MLAAALLGARALAEAVVDYRWHLALGDGAVAVWRARVAGLAVLRGVAAIVGAGFVYANLLAVVSSVDTVALPRRVGGLDFAERVPASRLRWVSAVAAPALGVLLAWPLDGWTAVDALATGRTLGEIEPYTGHDLAYFVHWLPLESALYTWALLALVVTAAIVIVLYALTPGLRWSGGRPHVSARVRRHLTVFGAGVLLLLAWGHRLDAYGLLAAGSGDAGAFTGADALGAMPARFGLAVATALAGVVVLRAGWANQRRLAFWTVTAVVLAALVVRAAAVPLTERLASPAALALADAGAAANRTLYTQRAFGVDRLRPAPPGYGVPDVPGAVSVWDAPALTRAVFTARRAELDGEPGFQPAAGPDGLTLAATFLERTAAGPGATPGDDDTRTVVTVDASTASATGRPVSLGGEALADAGRRVRVPFRPGAGGALLARADLGALGDPLDDWRVRLAHALAGRDLRLAFAGGQGGERLIARRDVRDRVEALAPFFTLGRQVTPIAVLDSLWYTVALYEASDAYPLAQRYAVNGADWSEFRHAGTALVNAGSGAVRLVPAAEVGLDVRAWVRRFPRLFTPAAALPPALARAIPPATEGALVQANAFAQFGARGERSPTPRRIAPSDASDTAAAGYARGVLLLPDVPPSLAPRVTPGARADAVENATLGSAWSLPLVSAADRVEGAVIALGGPDAATLWLPESGTGPRWQDLLDTLAGAGGAGGATEQGGATGATGERVFGRLRAVPVRGALGYVRPEYVLAGDAIPSLAGVVGTVGGATRLAATAAAALGLTSPAAAGRDVAGASGVDADPLARARAAYRDSREALRRGDWGAVGRALDALGGALAPRAGLEGARP